MDFGLIVDLETTGLSCEEDRIVELGLIEFAVEGEDPPIITGMYAGLEDPGRPIPPEVSKLTGLNEKIVAGRRIDWDLVKAHFERASIAIAHNASFDRGFLLRRAELSPLTIHWGCSMRHVNWEEHGSKARALNYLAADFGFVNPFAHRALFDCATTFRLIAPHLQELIRRSFERQFEVLAVNSPFETKDALRGRGYRWDTARRVWAKCVAECDLPAERAFLASQVYRDGGEPQEREILADATW